ncbi:MAG: hypothetical protein L0Y70_03550 [Gemmataceae bacterium]|nr:hypothetical protein [Gemmataceae bacterium]
MYSQTGGAQYGRGNKPEDDLLTIYAEAFERDADPEEFSLEGMIAHECGHQILARHPRIAKRVIGVSTMIGTKKLSTIRKEIEKALASEGQNPIQRLERQIASAKRRGESTEVIEGLKRFLEAPRTGNTASTAWGQKPRLSREDDNQKDSELADWKSRAPRTVSFESNSTSMRQRSLSQEDIVRSWGKHGDIDTAHRQQQQAQGGDQPPAPPQQFHRTSHEILLR